MKLPHSHQVVELGIEVGPCRVVPGQGRVVLSRTSDSFKELELMGRKVRDRLPRFVPERLVRLPGVVQQVRAEK